MSAGRNRGPLADSSGSGDLRKRCNAKAMNAPPAKNSSAASEPSPPRTSRLARSSAARNANPAAGTALAAPPLAEATARARCSSPGAIGTQIYGRHVIMVCDSVSCYVMGCQNVNTALQDHLQIKPGETTEDGKFTLLPIVCLGACDRAPVMLIDEDLVGDVRPDALESILSGYE